jgi:hypothetical protein
MAAMSGPDAASDPGGEATAPGSTSLRQDKKAIFSKKESRPGRTLCASSSTARRNNHARFFRHL